MVTQSAKQLHKNHSRERTGYFESVILIFFAKFSKRKNARKVNICIHLKCQPPKTAFLGQKKVDVVESYMFIASGSFAG